MKNVLLATLVLSAFSSAAFAKGSVDTYLAKCTKRTAYSSPTEGPRSNINDYVIESKIYSSHDKKEETEIYKYLSSSSNGEEFDISQDNGIAKITYTQLSETDEKISIVDNFEFESSDENGGVTVEKDSISSESIWRTIEKDEKKVVTLRISHTNNGKEVKEQLLRTKIIISPTEWTLDTMTINPQDVQRGDDQMLVSVRSCHFMKK